MPGSADGDRILPDWLWLKSLFSVEAPSDIPDPTEQGQQTGEPQMVSPPSLSLSPTAPLQEKHFSWS